MQTQERKGNSFFRGISLSQYMRDISCPEELDHQTKEQQSNDLYLQYEPQHPLQNYAIREIIDQDNYDQNMQQQLIVQPLRNFDLQKGRIVQVDESKAKGRNNVFKRPNNHLKNNSNIPFQDKLSPKKQMFRSLYGHSFGAGDNSKQKGSLLSTLGMSNWRGRQKSLNKKQLQLRDKNKRQYQELIKYQNVINQRFDNKLNSIRIDGIKDKIHDRSEKPIRREPRF